MNKIKTRLNNKLQDYKAKSSLEKRNAWVDFLTRNALYIVIAILVIYVTILFPDFLSATSLIDIMRKAAAKLPLALGVGGIIILTGTDLSVGRTVGLTACIAASLLQRTDYPSKMFPNAEPLPIFVVLLICIAIGALVGVLNGFFVAEFKLHPFVVTLATQMMLYGAVLIYVELGTNAGKPISGLTDSYSQIIKGSILEIGGTAIPNYVWYAIAITIIMWLIWNKTTLGKNMYAVGSNPEAATVSGVSVKKTTILVFLIAGILYGFSGFIEAARIGSNNASTGTGYETDAIAAVVIGGVSFSGGIGKISGVITGVILLQLVTVALQWLSVSVNLTYIIKGAIILFACAIDMRKYLQKK